MWTTLWRAGDTFVSLGTDCGVTTTRRGDRWTRVENIGTTAPPPNSPNSTFSTVHRPYYGNNLFFLREGRGVEDIT